MPHTKSLRADWSKRVYKYRCRLQAPLPQEAWDKAKAMQTLWNELIALLKEQCPTLRDDAEDDVSTTERKTLLHALFGKQAAGYCLVRDRGEALGLSYDEKWHVRDRFEQAMKAWGKRQSDAPHTHHGLERILLPYIPEQGGVPADVFFQRTEHPRFVYGPVESAHHYRKATFTLDNGMPISLLVLLHRPLPPQARLRQIALVGVFEQSLRHRDFDGWDWHLHFTLELPPRAPARARVAGIDFGWRVWQDGLRVAAIHDGAQAWEVLLPWDMSNRATKRRAAFLANHDQTLQATGKWRELWDWQERIDTALDACKAQLTEISTVGWSEAARDLYAKLDKLRAAGLRRLWRVLWEQSVSVPALDAWHAAHTLQMRRFRGTQLRLFRARNEWYRRIAVWLAVHCDVVAVEDVDLRGLATKGTEHRRARGQAGEHGRLSKEERILRKSQKNRQLAGVSILRQYIVEACTKHHKLVVHIPSPHTSVYCRCGARMMESADAWRICPEGHIQERDATSSFHIRQAAMGQEGATTHAPLPVLMDNGRELVKPLWDVEIEGLTLHEMRAPVETSTYGDTDEDDIPPVDVPAEVRANLALSD